MVEVSEKLINELNDLVRGCTEDSKQASEQLQEATGRIDETTRAVEQLRSDVDTLTNDMRSGIRAINNRVGDDRHYGGHFASRAHARAFGLAVLGVIGGNETCRSAFIEQAESLGYDVRAMTEGDGASGGVLVPETMHTDIIRLVELYGTFRRNVRVVPMAKDRDVWPKRTGGLIVYCPGETNAPTKSDASLASLAMQAKKWMTLTAISRELADDSAVAIAEIIAEEISLAFAEKEDRIGFLGDGSSTYFGYTGVLGHADTTVLQCETGDNSFADACKWQYLAGAVGQVPAWAGVDARYYFNRTVFWQYVVGQVDASGNPIVKFGSGGSAAGAPLQLGQATPLLLGMPVELVECLPNASASAASTDVWLYGSLKCAWMMGQVGRVRVDNSDQALFESDQIAIRGAERIAIAAAEAKGMVKVKTAA